jgi:hypothetical protein
VAQMYPPQPLGKTESNAERRLFDLIRDELPAEWAALHSLGLAHHPRKSWAEIDFVLIGPPGVFCLEVKGGRIRRDGGLWQFVDRNDGVGEKREGPFEQVGSASSALFGRLRDRFAWFSDVAVGYGVATPDQRWTVEGPDILPEVVYDENDTLRPFSAYTRRLTDYWSGRLEERRNGRPLNSLDERNRRELLDALRGDFDLRPSLRARLQRANDVLFALTKEQYNVLDGLTENPRAIIRGGAGSGKTLLAAEEACRRAAMGQRVLLTCYNRRLGAFLREALGDRPNLDVRHLHGFMWDIVDAAGLTARLPAVEEADLFRVFYPELCLEALDRLGRLESYDVLIVDEAQDLLIPSYLDVLEFLLKGSLERGLWRFFLDPSQDLFSGTSVTAPTRLLQGSPVLYRLTVNCRNTAPIGIASTLLSGVDCDETLVAEGPETEQEWYRDANHQRRLISRCINRMLSQGIAPSDMVILSRYRRENGCLKSGLEDVPFPIADLEGHRPPVDAKVISYATIGAYKGLESDVVLVADIDDLDNPDALSAVYVGTTRAKALLGLFLDERIKLHYEERAFDYGRRMAARRESPTPFW